MRNTLIDLLLIAALLRALLLTAAAVPLFDESFYIQSARVMLSGGIDPNPEHPLFAKCLIASSMTLFGDNPLGWRLFPMLAGIASVGLFYLIALKLGLKERLAMASALLIALDPLHIVLSRLAMLDIFAFAFSLAGLYVLLSARPPKRLREKTVVGTVRQYKGWLLAGILFGLGIASKWPAALMLAGALAFMFIGSKRRMELVRPSVALLFAAAAVYIATYLPLIAGQGFVSFIGLQLSDLRLHAFMPAAMQNSEPWEWLFGRVPVWFGWYKPDLPLPPDWLLFIPNLLGMQASFAVIALGNPVTWWLSLIALSVIFGGMLLQKTGIIKKVKELSKAELFALVWFTFNWSPWLLIPRGQSFLYYMLPVLPAYALATVCFVNRYPHKLAIPALLAVAAISLAVFYPLLIALPMPVGYFDALRWWIGFPPV